FTGTIGKVDVGVRVDKCFECGDVALATVSEHNRFDQRGPSEIVDMIKGSVGGNERPHDLIVTEMGRGDQRGPLIGAGYVGGFTSAFKPELEHWHIVSDRSDRDDIVLL